MDSDITLHVAEDEEPITLTVVEAALRPEQEKTVSPQYDDPLEVLPDAGKVLSKVIVEPIPEPTETETYTENGSYNVARIGTAVVNVPQGVFPEGTLLATANGAYDVTEYAAVNVAVPIIFDMGLLTMELLTVTVDEDFNGVLNGALAALYNLVPADKKAGGAINTIGILYVSLVDSPDTADQLVTLGAHYNNALRTIGRKYDGTKIATLTSPSGNIWAVKLKAGTRYKLAWMRYE